MILDASALLAFLQNERGCELVAGALAEAEMSLVNYSEVITKYARIGAPIDQARERIEALPLTLIAPDMEQAQLAGALDSVTRSAGLSLGDRYCLALAKTHEAAVWTADQAWLEVADQVGVEVRLIR